MKISTHAGRCYLSVVCWVLMIVLTLFNYSCARITALSGGPKDITPPQLMKVFPTQESTGFKGKVIRLVFDKEIEVTDIYNKLVVTPRLQKLDKQSSYTCYVRGKTLKLTLHVPLEEETTYTFNFNDAIRDVTEGNIAVDPVLTFSTGDYVDAMYVTGQVNHLMTQLPAPKALVALYTADNERLHILNSPPDYFTRTDEQGNFKLNHIKKGKYYMCASNNKGYQLIGNPGVDEYGFLKHPIDLTVVPRDNVTLFILKADVRAFKLQSQQPQGRYFELSFNKPLEDYTLDLAHNFEEVGSSTLYSQLVADKQIIRVYNTFGLSKGESLEARLTAKDASGNVIEENVTIHFREGVYQDYPASYVFEPTSGTALHPDFTGTMTVSKPVKEVIASYLRFYLNGQGAVWIDAKDLQFNAQRDTVTIKKQFDPGMMTPLEKRNHHTDKGAKELVLQMDEGAFVTVEGDVSKEMRYVYTLRHPEEFGTIKGTVTTEAPGFVVQLLDLENNVIDSVRNRRHYQFDAVAPGSYRIRLLILQDKEGEWSFGNIYERREPDPVVFYPDAVAVIANWEIEGIDFSF